MGDYIIILIIIICEELFKYNRKKIPLKIIKQLTFISGCITLFFLSALISPLSNKQDIMLIALYGLVIVQFFIYLLFYVIKREKKTVSLKAANNFLCIKELLATYKFQIFIFLITFISRIWQIRAVQKWDSEEYFYAIMQGCDGFDFTLHSFFDGFKLIAHPSQGYGFWTGIGAFLIPTGVEGILLIVLLMTCIANVKLYGLLKSYWIRMTDKQALQGTIMCLFIPLYWATCSYLTPDYLIIVFIIFMMDAERKENWITFFFWSIMVCFSKEIGIVMIASYFGVRVLCKVFFTEGNLGIRMIQCVRRPSVYVGIIDGGIILLYMLLNRGISSWKHSVYYSNPISWGNSLPSEILYNTFGVQFDNILTRLKQYFLVNFAWVFTIILMISILVYLHRKTSLLRGERILELLAILAGYGIFMCLYITSGAMRYNLVFTVLFVVLSYVVLIDICPQKVSSIISIVISVFLLIQSFYSIDVVTNKIFRTVDVGNTKLLCIAQESHKNPGGDYYVNNLQYLTINKNIEKMLKAVQFKEEDLLLIAGKDYLEGNKNHSLIEANGRHNTIRWDKETGIYKNRYNSEQPIVHSTTTNKLWGRRALPDTDTVNITAQIKKIIGEIQGRLFVYFSPFYQSQDKEAILQQLSQVFEIGEMKVVETWGNQLEYCEVFPKTEKEINSLNLNKEKEILSIEQQNRKEYYTRMQEFAVDFIDRDSNLTVYGDTIAVTIMAYEDGKFVNLGYSPKGTVLHTITLGTNQVFTQIEEALVNRNVGEIVPVRFRFPKDYQNNTEVAGKELELRVLINTIKKEIPQDTIKSNMIKN